MLLLVCPQKDTSTYTEYSHSSCVRAKSLQSCPTLCDPMDCRLPGFWVHIILGCLGAHTGGPRPALGGRGQDRPSSGSSSSLQLSAPLTCRGEWDVSQKVAVEIPYDLQTRHFTVPSPAELGDVGGGPRRVLGSSRQLCEAGPGDRGRRFHVGNGAAGRVVAPRKPGLSLRLCLPLAPGTGFGDLIDRGRVLTHDLDRSTFPPFRGLRRRGSSETTISFKRLPIQAEAPWYCPPF